MDGVMYILSTGCLKLGIDLGGVYLESA
jgi:hypothetical protein